MITNVSHSLFLFCPFDEKLYQIFFIKYIVCGSIEQLLTIENSNIVEVVVLYHTPTHTSYARNVSVTKNCQVLVQISRYELMLRDWSFGIYFVSKRGVTGKHCTKTDMLEPSIVC